MTEEGHTERPQTGVRTFWGIDRRIAPVVGIMFALAATYAVILWGVRPAFTTDTSAYQQAAQDLLTQKLFPLRTIGYPIILAATGSSQRLTVALGVLQLGFHLAAVWMTLVIARRFDLSRWASLVLAALLLSPPLMAKSLIGLTEASCEFFLVLATLELLRWVEHRRYLDGFAAGVSVAVAALIRPTYQLLGVSAAVGVAWWLWRRDGDKRKAVRTGLAIAAGSIVLVGGMTLFYGVRWGAWSPAPSLGWNLTTKTAPFIERLPDDEPAKAMLVAWRNESVASDPAGDGLRYIWGHVSEAVDTLSGNPTYGPSNRDYAAVSSKMTWLNLRLMIAQPSDYLASVAAAGGRYVQPLSTGSGLERAAPYRLASTSLFLLVLGGFVAQLLLVPGLMVARASGAKLVGPVDRPEARWAWCLATSVVGYTAVVSIALDTGDARFRTPTDTLILLLTFGGLTMARRATRRRGPER